MVRVSRRIARLNEQLRREISEILNQHVRDPRVGPITVTGVRVTADLWSARVLVRPALGGGEDRWEDVLEGLEAATPFVRRELGSRLRVRRIPELRFMEDRSMEHAMRIEEILNEVLPEDEVEEDSE